MSGAGEDAPGHWTEIARRWDAVGPPLRPCRADVAAYEAIAADEARRRGAPLRALLLGVTPEIAALAWPRGTRLVAADHTRGMIEAVWKGPRGRALCAQWTALPLRTASQHIAFCDGGLHLLPHPHGQAAFAAELRRVLAPGGACVLRLFVPPAARESAAAVLADLAARRIACADLLKLRLAMALQGDAVRGVRLADVWNAVARIAPGAADLAALTGWPLAKAEALTTYRDRATAYHFVTLDEAERVLCGGSGGLTVESVRASSYELGERCPVVVLRREA